MDFSILERLKLWQLLLVLSVLLAALGFTGTGVFGSADIIEGKENYAIIGAFLLLVFAVLLRYIPPRETRIRERSQVTISASQVALCAQIVEWTSFVSAAELHTTDGDLKLKELRIKNTQLRLELGTAQGLLMRRVTNDGVHEVKYRYLKES